MTSNRVHRARVWRHGAALLVLLTSLALAQTVSEPPVVLPEIPDADSTTLEIPDLDDAPAIARDAILQLALLGAYPLGADMLAYPNLVLDHATAAFMLVNLFSLRLADEFPVPAEAALVYFEVVTETQVEATAPVTVGLLRDYILVFVGLTTAPPDEVRAALDEGYPALAAGNLDAPITRAGAALMIMIAFEAVTSRPS